MVEMQDAIAAKTKELETELKATGLWQNVMPDWVHWYQEGSGLVQPGFAQWLQFVFIPNHLHKSKMIPAGEKQLIVPHAIRCFGEDVRKGKLLQLLIEIDSLL